MGPCQDQVAKPTVESLDEARDDGFTRRHVRIQIAPDRTTDDAYLLVPDGRGPFPAVVVVFYDAKTGIGQGTGKLRDYALQLARRGFVTLSLGSAPEAHYPSKVTCQLQPRS